MKSEHPHVLHNHTGGLIFLSKCKHETSKNILSGDALFEGADTR